MACYTLEQIFRQQGAIIKFCKHGDAAFIVGFMIDFFSLAVETAKPPRAMNALHKLFALDEGEQLLLLPGFTERIVASARKLLKNKLTDHWTSVLCQLLSRLVNATQPAWLLSGPTEIVGSFIASLCGLAHGKTVLDALVPVLQWDQQLVRFLSLEYKQKWVSDQIKKTGQEGGVHIAAQRQQLLGGFLRSVGQLF